MKVCIPATNETPDALVDSAFGRCKYLQFADTQTEQLYYRENTYRKENSGAGTQVAQLVLSEGAEAVLSREVGPKAARVLGERSVDIYSVGEISVRDAVNHFKQGKLKLVT